MHHSITISLCFWFKPIHSQWFKLWLLLLGTASKRSVMFKQQYLSFTTQRKYSCTTFPCHAFQSAHQQTSSPLAQGILCPLTSAPFGHNNQRRHAEQRRLAPRYPASAPPGRGRHPAGDRPDGIYHDTDGWDGK